MKQQLTEALEAWDQRDWSRQVEAVVTVQAAARLVERLLPGECEMCDGMGTRSGYHASGPIEDWTCEFCHGSGQVWDEGMLDHIMEAASFRSLDTVIAVLSALVELLTEKVP